MLLDLTAPAAPYLLLILGILALLVVNLLLALVEGVALTLLNWNPFRLSMRISFIMNILSGILNSAPLIFLQRSPLWWIPISFVVSLLVEWFILTYFKRDSPRQNAWYALLVNLLSYLLLILPAYYFGARR